MGKKNISATILVIFLAITFSVIGICFSTFVYKNKRTIVKEVTLSAVSGIDVYFDEDLTQKAEKLNLSKMDLGLKPATGELDQETEIPSTINDQGTSEGYYASVYVLSSTNFKITLSNIVIQSDHNEDLIEEEKKNIFIAIKDVEDSVKTFENNNVVLANFNSNTLPTKITFLIWLGGLASDELEGAEISFKLNFVSA